MDMKCLIVRKNDLILYIHMHFSIQSIIDRLFLGNGANIYFSNNNSDFEDGMGSRKK